MKNTNIDYYFFLRPCAGDMAGITKIERYLQNHLENFIYYDNVEKWFDIDPLTFPGLAEYDNILDFKGNAGIKTIALYMSPYKRVFTYFLTAMNIKEFRDFEYLSNKVTVENFTSYCEEHKSDPTGYISNLEDVYKADGDLKIHYQLEYDTLIDDVRKIPGLEKIPDAFVANYQSLINRYREFYTPQTRNLVEEIFKKDIEQRGYTF